MLLDIYNRDNNTMYVHVWMCEIGGLYVDGVEHHWPCSYFNIGGRQMEKQSCCGCVPCTEQGQNFHVLSTLILT